MQWRLSYRADALGAALADRHYSRQQVGARQFVPPGACLVLLAPGALWVTTWPRAEYVQHAWAGAWLCSIFRNEGATLSSVLIREAIAATRWRWPAVPALGMVSFVNPAAVRHKRDPGRCFRRAGFRVAGTTKERGFIALQLLESEMPPAEAPLEARRALPWDAV